MENVIRQICGLSILCGVALTLAPEGSARRAMSFVCSVVLLSCVLTGFKSLDWEEYAVETALYREREQRFLEQSDEIRDELDRRVIESECRTYVLEQSRRLGLSVQDVSVHVEWNMEGVWVPYSVTIVGAQEGPERTRLTEILETELGIPKERQEWKSDD